MEKFGGPEAVRSSWNEPEEESLSCLDAIISQVDDLEEEDIICLEDFVFRDGNIGLGLASPESEDCVELPQTNCEHETSGEGDGSTLSVDTFQSDSVAKHGRRCRNQPRNMFVSYEVLPSTKVKGYMCEVCGDRFSRKDSRRRHILSRHVKEKTYVCNICNKAFVFQFALTAHQAIHSSSAKYLCICGLAYTIRSSFLSHIRRIHVSEDDKVYLCELCPKSFKNYQALKCHVVAVHRAKTIKCLQNGCNKTFSTNGLMRSHYRYHLNMKYDCGICGQSFSTEGYMKRHKLTHLGVRPHVCSKCGKSYVNASHLSRHQKVHSDERPFQCSFCGKHYKSKEHVAFHENIHRGEKPFKCAICGYATAYKGTYYAHRKKHAVNSIGSKETVSANNEPKRPKEATTSVQISETLQAVNDCSSYMLKDSKCARTAGDVSKDSKENPLVYTMNAEGFENVRTATETILVESKQSYEVMPYESETITLYRADESESDCTFLT